MKEYTTKFSEVFDANRNGIIEVRQRIHHYHTIIGSRGQNKSLKFYILVHTQQPLTP